MYLRLETYLIDLLTFAGLAFIDYSVLATDSPVA